MSPESPQADVTVAVHACSGATASARLAQDVAERLRELAADGSIGMRVIAVDGCASGCSSRRLAGQGVDVDAVSLDMLGVEPGTSLDDRERDALASEIAARLAAGASATATLAPKRRPEPPPVSAASATATHTVDDYLFAIALLTAPVGACGALANDVPTLASHVARALGVSRAAAGEMLARMEEAGDVERGMDKVIVLGERGRAAADRILARHRIVERFLTDVLGYTAGESHALALEVRGSFPPDAIDRLRDLVAPATTCPHGWPLEPGTGMEAARDLIAVSALPLHEPRRVAAVAEHDGRLLSRLCDLGLEPGAPIEVASHGPPTVVVAGGAELRLEPHEAAAVLVRLSAPS